MNSVEELMSSVDGGREPPDGLATHLLALWLARKGRWHDAHEVAQEIETTMGSWIHAVATVDANGEMKLYRSGVLVGTQTASSSPNVVRRCSGGPDWTCR